MVEIGGGGDGGVPDLGSSEGNGSQRLTKTLMVQTPSETLELKVFVERFARRSVRTITQRARGDRCKLDERLCCQGRRL